MIPVSLSCTVAHTRPHRREARASMARTMAGWTSATRPRTASADSTPVVPSTPVRKADTGRNPANCFGMAESRCRVISTLSNARGQRRPASWRVAQAHHQGGALHRQQGLQLRAHGPDRPLEKSAFRCQKVVRSMVK